MLTWGAREREREGDRERERVPVSCLSSSEAEPDWKQTAIQQRSHSTEAPH